MRAVLISIQPKWCELIASGKKKVEVRKSRPKLETPFKCYIYCTKDNSFAEKTLRGFDENGKAIYYKAHKGKVIGEFVCDQIDEIGYSPEMHGKYICDIDDIHYVSCVNFEQMFDYLADGYGYAWHISDLVIYDEPRELSEFCRECDYEKDCGDCPYLYVENTPSCYETWCEVDGFIPLKRPPQSWCYVEEDKG